jgi:hypothetical protein
MLKLTALGLDLSTRYCDTKLKNVIAANSTTKKR